MFFQVYGANALVQWGMLLVVLAGLILWEWRTWPNTLICSRKKKNLPNEKKLYLCTWF